MFGQWAAFFTRDAQYRCCTADTETIRANPQAFLMHSTAAVQSGLMYTDHMQPLMSDRPCRTLISVPERIQLSFNTTWLYRCHSLASWASLFVSFFLSVFFGLRWMTGSCFAVNAQTSDQFWQKRKAACFLKCQNTLSAAVIVNEMGANELKEAQQLGDQQSVFVFEMCSRFGQMEKSASP